MKEEARIEWDLQRLCAVGVAVIAVLVTLSVSLEWKTAAGQAYGLLFPLAVIFWPVSMDEIYRQGPQGFAQSRGERPPTFMIQVVGWLVLLFLAIWPLLMTYWAPAN